MWAIILYDEKEKKIICSRDRFGIKPLYYTRIANRLYFASEIKAFQAIKDWQPKINHTRLMEYLAYNMSDNTEETMFANVYQIPKSHHGVICLQANDMCINRYYDIRKGEQNDGSKFMELFYDAIKLRTKTDVPLATTLSGGMDSSSIVSVMANKMEYKPTTYTLAYPGYKLDESNFALKVNQKYKIASHLTTTTEEYLTQHIDNLVYHQDEPFAGITVMAQSNIYENINRDGHKVVLGGQGSDEILCGYDKFILGYFKEKIKKQPLVAIAEMFKFQKTRSFGIKDALLKIVSYENNKRKSLVDWYILNEEQDNMRFKKNQENNIFEMSHNLLFGLGVSALLRYEDRNSMSFGIESRLPFLDHRLVEYCLHMESGLKLKGGITKDILRKSMKDIVPEDIINRNDKMGFATPQKEWMNNNKNYYIGLASSSLDKMPFVNRKKVHALMLKDTNLLWRIINVGLWISKFKLTA
jgi:asparagine synthase (glutamine-hydrolysing)